MRFRTSPSSAAAETKNRTSDDLRNEYKLIGRGRDLGENPAGAIADQNDIARDLERRGEL